ncbi:meiotically up-regulated protein [Physcia stellaris]|nr:meiotically up-regulated protein [Physcia stellaris]
MIANQTSSAGSAVLIRILHPRPGTRQDVRHADDEEGEQERAGEEGGCEAGAGVEGGVRGHCSKKIRPNRRENSGRATPHRGFLPQKPRKRTDNSFGKGLQSSWAYSVQREIRRPSPETRFRESNFTQLYGRFEGELRESWEGLSINAHHPPPTPPPAPYPHHVHLVAAPAQQAAKDKLICMPPCVPSPPPSPIHLPSPPHPIQNTAKTPFPQSPQQAKTPPPKPSTNSTPGSSRPNAAACTNPKPSAFSTASLPTGSVSSRYVYLKELDSTGFVIYSNWGTSRKAQDVASNPQASLAFWWREQERQVRVEGPVERLSSAESQVYFSVRARGSKIGAWASRQSAVLAEREVLERQVREQEERWEGTKDEEIPVPEFWGGLRYVHALYTQQWYLKATIYTKRLVATTLQSSDFFEYEGLGVLAEQ